MQAANLRVCLVTLLASALSCAAEPPSNDQFENATALRGSSIVFTGTLQNATIVRSEIQDTVCLQALGAPRSVWYSWTASEDTPAFLHVVSYSTTIGPNAVSVYPATNLPPGFPVYTNGPFPAHECVHVDRSVVLPQVAFMAVSNTTYFFQVLGDSVGPFAIRLDATPSPLILEEPKGRTVFSGESVVFKVTAAGSVPLQYQWKHNDTDLVGETSPMLLISNVNLSHSGSYSVEIRNDFGPVLSEPVELVVSEHAGLLQLSPILRLPRDSLCFRLSGEAGRSYRIQSTTNFASWTNEVSFPAGPGRFSSVIINTNSQTELAVSNTELRKFFRALTYRPAHDGCNGNLKLIRHAKEMWARSAHRTSTHHPQAYELLPYYKDGQPPRCPVGGIYFINAVQWWPTCTLSGHALEEPR